MSAYLQEEGEALQGQAFASDNSSADALSNVRALLELGELSEHDGDIVGTCQGNHCHTLCLLWGWAT